MMTHLLVLALAFTGAAGEGPGDPPVQCDLAVIGGGSGGFAATLAAARLDVDVVLVEQGDCLGGTSVRGGVNCWEPGIGGTGIPFDVYKRLRQTPGAIGVYSFGRHISWFDPKREPFRFPGGETVIDPSRRYLDTLQRHGSRGMAADEAFFRDRVHGVPFEPEAMASTMLAMLVETGHCRVLLNTAFVSAEVRDGRSLRPTLEWPNHHRRLLHRCQRRRPAMRSVGCESMLGQESRERFGEPRALAVPGTRVNGVSLIYRVMPKDVAGIEPLGDGVPEKCWWAKTFPLLR